MAVLWVSIHVLRSSVPSSQSFCPAGVNCSGRGGTETVPSTASVVVAPSINEPARKQTRWSCLGDNRHVLTKRFIKRQTQKRRNFEVIRTLAQPADLQEGVQRCMSNHGFSPFGQEFYGWLPWPLCTSIAIERKHERYVIVLRTHGPRGKLVLIYPFDANDTYRKAFKSWKGQQNYRL